MNNIRIGIGYDVHPLVSGRRLVLGGIEIPFGYGLDGWSDADVLTHAIIDALLGAAALGDIGTHYPPGNPEYKDISSLRLLSITRNKLKENGWSIGNIDTTIMAEQPKLAGYIDKMRKQLSDTLGITLEQINIKATTSEKLGFIGRGEGITTCAIALLKES